MPVDLSPSGLPSVYPPHGPRFWPWLGIWAICCVLGAALALLLWPRGEPARGPWFWFCVVGLPNGVFGILLGIARAGYEGFWRRAHSRNVHRSRWLRERVRVAQRPLQVLGASYCLPLGGQKLAEVMAAAKPLPASQAPRTGSGLIIHNRFADGHPIADELTYAALWPDGESAMTPAKVPKELATVVLKLAQALEPLSETLRALAEYDRIHWPQVRVLAAPNEAATREQQVRDALRIAGLPPLHCQAVPASDGLLVADAWLDSGERRPILVIATAWHDASPPVGSTEGCVAVLLGPGFYKLPEPVKVRGTLHRPVAGEMDELEYVFANAAIWGKAEGPAVTRAWISGLTSEHDTTLLAALGAASLSGVAKHETQSRVDRIVGDAGAANPWLSVAAAIESRMSGPQLVADRATAAILYVTPDLTKDSTADATWISSHDDAQT
jgi:hypothetical protein